MRHASFRFYGPLNDFVAPRRRFHSCVHQVQAGTTVKDAVESLGVPHPEIDLILANDRSIDFAYQVRDDDRIAAYPRFFHLDVASVSLVRPVPLETVRFVLDVHLGRLASYLRLAGFDTRYANDSADEALARLSRDEQRILLTRDPGLLKRSIVKHGSFVRETRPRHQLVEILERFDLVARMQPFGRCARCNAILEPASTQSVAARVPPRVRDAFDRFWMCPGCHRVYWRGSHWQRVSTWFNEVVEDLAARDVSTMRPTD